MTTTSNITSSKTITISDIITLRTTLKPLRKHNTIALVPTMGNLHQGHLSLVKIAKQQADIVVVSIFVNPTQFGVGEDLDSYPRTLEADTKLLQSVGADYIFTPSVAQMYPVMPPPTQVLAGQVSSLLCGQSRPTHFNGVGLVVSKLFNIIQPDVAVFGKKDYQQLAIIRQIVRDLSYDIKIVGGAIVRADDGLALSSRNQYLSDQQRQLAPALNRQLITIAQSLNQGDITDLTSLQHCIDQSIEHLNAIGFKVDYLEVYQPDLTPVTDIEQNKNLVILVAAWLGSARLLDNLEVTLST